VCVVVGGDAEGVVAVLVGKEVALDLGTAVVATLTGVSKICSTSVTSADPTPEA